MLSKGLDRAARVLCAAVFTGIFVLGLFANSLADLALGAGMLLLFTLVCAALRRCGERTLTVLFTALLVGFAVALYLVGLQIRVRPSWDFGRIYAGAAELLQSGGLETSGTYYLESLNNLFPTLWLAGFVRLSSVFGPVNMFSNIVLLNALSIALSVLFLFLAARTAFGVRTAFAASLLCFGCAPLYAYSPIVYTDTLSLPLMTLCALLCAAGLRRERRAATSILYGAGAGLCAFVGWSLKPTAAFPLVAALLLVLLARRDGWKFAASAVGLFAVCAGGWQLWLQNCGLLDLSLLDADRLPPMHYLRMGLIGSGGYNGASHTLAASLPDAAARTAQARAEIAALLREYGAGGLLEHTRVKLLYTWNDGLYYSTSILSQDIYHITDLHQIVLSDGKYYPILRAYAQGAQLAVLGSLCAGSLGFAFRRRDPQEAPLVPIVWLTLLGVAVFLLFWETRSRYLVNCLPLFALAQATVGFALAGKLFRQKAHSPGAQSEQAGRSIGAHQ